MLMHWNQRVDHWNQRVDHGQPPLFSTMDLVLGSCFFLFRLGLWWLPSNFYLKYTVLNWRHQQDPWCSLNKHKFLGNGWFLFQWIGLLQKEEQGSMFAKGLQVNWNFTNRSVFTAQQYILHYSTRTKNSLQTMDLRTRRHGIVSTRSVITSCVSCCHVVSADLIF